MLDELKAVQTVLQKQTGNESAAANSSFYAMMSSAVRLKQSDSQLLPLIRLIKEFERIILAYEQDNLYLGEAAMVMVQVIVQSVWEGVTILCRPCSTCVLLVPFCHSR